MTFLAISTINQPQGVIIISAGVVLASSCKGRVLAKSSALTVEYSNSTLGLTLLYSSRTLLKYSASAPAQGPITFNLMVTGVGVGVG
jgi:hypothetical protein